MIFGNAPEVWFLGVSGLADTPCVSLPTAETWAYARHLYLNRGTKRFVLGQLARHAGA